MNCIANAGKKGDPTAERLVLGSFPDKLSG
ncbi:hypothetical protein BN381_20004 [Candidatus Microthrix parvicella RN1]|uniref:Uncharacterized protein n=1 Tax=Candidatus Neomicrothrix parvicella RN1 TaxID=1229780 RepID=R4YY02_9ACTN|nr:hypothetical protein BN381_20004 [Candidatus Microthrix parvicella RN1]